MPCPLLNTFTTFHPNPDADSCVQPAIMPDYRRTSRNGPKELTITLLFNLLLFEIVSVADAFPMTAQFVFANPRSHHVFVRSFLHPSNDLIEQGEQQEHHQKSEKVDQLQSCGDILILDHLNINHERGRHDWLRSFYFDFLGCAVDPRKEENLAKGKKTIWANIGAHQFHLPEGTPDAQVWNGFITLLFPNVSKLLEQYECVKPKLQGTKFQLVKVKGNVDHNTKKEKLEVTDPWGTKFLLIQADENQGRDPRGVQPKGETSQGLALQDLTLYVPPNCNLSGIARFYQFIFNAPIQDLSSDRCVVSVGPYQTLTFQSDPGGRHDLVHHDLRAEQIDQPEGQSSILSNYGPHISMYIKDLPMAFQKAKELGVVYVNPRFKRQAYTLEDAMNDCMFRCLDIVDPENPQAGAIVELEHEIRSVVKQDGSMYKSCPFREIPRGCTTLLR